MAADARSVLERLRGLAGPLRRLALVAPSRDERALFPSAEVLTAAEWDLGSPRPDLRFDLVVAPRVLHDPRAQAARLRNLLRSCRALLTIERPPSSGGVSPGAGGTVPAALADRVIARGPLDRGAHGAGDTVVLVRGELDAPLIRMDDYPTGVRPILPDLAPLHAIVRSFDDRGLPVALGIVPALLDPSMVGFLRSLRHLVPALHGFDHGYFRYAPRLRRSGDPYNERGTVGQFDEFRWQRARTVERKLGEAKRRLEDELARPVTIYVPPCNRVDGRTARVLRRVGFELCLCDGAVPADIIPWRRSDFYGRSSEFGPETDAEVITLHATWEWDVRRTGDTRSLSLMLELLVGSLAAKRAAIERLASEVSASRAG
ncbi:DUF2334 domain-containing protein [Anaeromyxobacter sp. Fw109-5]|uniref:DUF2334 domain-containing protein n=1 Tax=Anaeromyxobacter sp. (strain Fw109-5) TaxID=404589 RepID=UPI000158A6E1|nr:DUF2334 domain-containing protein [Anaeromyxobacter sp. Fw109-5]ABS25450.1 hypothetical protein Anae109_1242 [Anaeromyxobacter sp. Fw109-5]